MTATKKCCKTSDRGVICNIYINDIATRHLYKWYSHPGAVSASCELLKAWKRELSPKWDWRFFPVTATLGHASVVKKVSLWDKIGDIVAWIWIHVNREKYPVQQSSNPIAWFWNTTGHVGWFIHVFAKLQAGFNPESKPPQLPYCTLESNVSSATSLTVVDNAMFYNVTAFNGLLATRNVMLFLCWVWYIVKLTNIPK